MKNIKKTISISVDKALNDDMEDTKVNKSKLINHLLKKYLSDNQEDINIFKKK